MRYAYDDAGRLIEEVGITGGRYRMRYDGQGRCVEATGDNGYGRRSVQYDDYHLLTLVVDSLGNVTTYRLNETGQVTSTIRPDGGRHSVVFDERGRIRQRTGPLGEITRYEYDSRGDTTRVVYADDAAEEIRYDDFHQATEIHQPGDAVWRMRYEQGAVAAVTDPAGATTSYVLDQYHLPVEIRPPSGAPTRIERSADWSHGRPCSTISASSKIGATTRG